MSYKSIELQIAIPRTLDAARIQEQTQQRAQLAGELAAAELQKKEEKRLSSVAKQEQKGGALLTDDGAAGGKMNPSGNSEKSKTKSREERPAERHPYKGKRVDYSG